jgi:TolA-binding protein
MTSSRSKVERAIAALREDVWSDLQHRRGAERLGVGRTPLQRVSRRWPGVALAFAAAAALALAVGVLQRPMSPPSHTVLRDGSAVDVAPGGRIQVAADTAQSTRIEVLAGRADFEVEKRLGRPFVASVHGVEVRVIGTHFSTELDASRPPGVVRIAVSRGVVEVVSPDGKRLASLTAGESLEVSLAPVVLAVPSVAAEEKPLSPVASAEPPSSSAEEPAASAPRSTSLDAATLFELAHDARAAGHVPAAINAYQSLLKQFPSDPRVGVAALELGRLRMDSQHAYAPAADAFRRALAAARNDGLREDALARLVEALSAMRDRSTCSAEQQRYLSRYPNGVHAAAVRACCPAP